MVSHDYTKFGGHRHCGSGDIMDLVVTFYCKITRSKGHVTLWV